MIQIVCKSFSVRCYPAATYVTAGLLAITIIVYGVIFLTPELSGLRCGATIDFTSKVSKNLVFPLEIEARGRHHEWSFRYPGQDDPGLYTTNTDVIDLVVFRGLDSGEE